MPGNMPPELSPQYRAGIKDALIKLAGTIDRKRLNQFAKGLRYGDIINFDDNIGDVLENSLEDGRTNLTISNGIRKFTGGPDHHTAMFAGRHPRTRKLMILHNAGGLHYEPLENYAHQAVLRAYRVPGATDKEAAKALGKVFALYRQGGSWYPDRNAIAAALPALAQRAKEKGTALSRLMAAGLNVGSGLIGRNCPPGTSICSSVPVQAYADVMGRDRAFQIFAGEHVPQYREQWTVNPTTIAKNLSPVGVEYRPADSAGRGIGGAVRGFFRNDKVKGFLSNLASKIRR